MNLDKNKMKDSQGRYITQGLFLEQGYNLEYAMFTLDGEDKEYKGKTYISLKKLYLEYNDLEEYEFAYEYLYDWEHWEKMCNNKNLLNHIIKWRKELELLNRSEAIKNIQELAANGSYQANKFLADRGWVKRGAGRPTNEEKQEELAKVAKMEQDYLGDVLILENHKKDS